MKKFADPKKLTEKVAGYATGNSDALKDPALLQAVRLRRRQLSRMMSAFDLDTASKRLPPSEYAISRKYDGEFAVLYYDGGDVITLNPGGSLRAGAMFHEEAAALLKKAKIKKAMLGGEVYARHEDGKRAWVHDATRLSRAPKTKEDVERLCFAVFNIYDLDGEDLSMRYFEAIEKAQTLFRSGNRIHPVETVMGEDFKAVRKQYKKWVQKEGAEGVVARSDAAGVFKIKPRHTLDLAVVGYSEGVDDRAGMLHSMLLGIVRKDGAFQIIGRVGGGFSDDERAKLLKTLRKHDAESDYVEVNSDRVAYRMIQPGVVVEISCLDIISQTSRGGTIDRMVIEWDAAKKAWQGVRRLPLASIISPQFLRLRDDKSATADDVKLSQLTDIAHIPETDRTAKDVKLPASTVLKRAVATKELRGALMVRKIVMWKTNKEKTSRDHPAYVIHLTDFSPNRKDPLQHDIRVSSSKKQIEGFWAMWEKAKFKKGWVVQE